MGSPEYYLEAHSTPKVCLFPMQPSLHLLICLKRLLTITKYKSIVFIKLYYIFYSLILNVFFFNMWPNIIIKFYLYLSSINIYLFVNTNIFLLKIVSGT